ncbi:MAG: helix-turn-helix transcriptional regulator [Candidatus Omnitrophota bacterium]
MNDFDSDYPKNPQSLGESIRKIRMDRGLLIKDLAGLIGVTEDTIINWELRSIAPHGKQLKKICTFLGGSSS